MMARYLSLLAAVILIVLKQTKEATSVVANTEKVHIRQQDQQEISNEISTASSSSSYNSIKSRWAPQIKAQNLKLTRYNHKINNEETNDDGASKRLFEQLQGQLLSQAMRQSLVEKDHLMMEKWLVDNINDLHRELKQTESDFEHYVQVTKKMIAQNERLMRQQVRSLPGAKMLADHDGQQQLAALLMGHSYHEPLVSAR